jgi:hypothetical protein
MNPLISKHENQFIFSPSIAKEYSGKKYYYMGEYHRDPYLINSLKHLLAKNGYIIKIQQDPHTFIVWGRKR